jgi:PcfJ-like protein
MSAVKAKCGTTPNTEPAELRRELRLDAFHPDYRRIIGEFTSSSAALEDLADTFPGLLFALASNYATADQRRHTLEMIHAGVALREIASVLDLPWWLRKLPPRAFAAPLPKFPLDRDFTFRISNLIPHDEQMLPTWLTHVGHACEACGPAYALWIARQPDLTDPLSDMSRVMAAWAWFSQRAELPGHRLLRRAWSFDMSFRRACEELAAWRQRLRLVECLGSGIESPWLADGTALDFDFVALRTVDDFIAESEALDNCLDQYADHLHSGRSAVFSIRKGERRVACVEIGLHDEEVTMPNIVQLRAARNRRAPPEIWQATYAWLGGQALEPLSPDRHVPKPIRRAEARRKMWGPYLAFLAGTPHEPPFRRLMLEQAGGRREMRRRPGAMQRPAVARRQEAARGA